MSILSVHFGSGILGWQIPPPIKHVGTKKATEQKLGRFPLSFETMSLFGLFAVVRSVTA